MNQFKYSTPDVNYVRCHQFTKIKSEILPVLKNKGFNLYKLNVEIIIKNALKTCISDSRMDFWFYDLFGLDKITKKDIYALIAKKCCEEKNAMMTIKLRFVPYLIHYLYKPCGFSYNILKRNTLVGR